LNHPIGEATASGTLEIRKLNNFDIAAFTKRQTRLNEFTPKCRIYCGNTSHSCWRRIASAAASATDDDYRQYQHASGCYGIPNFADAELHDSAPWK